MERHARDPAGLLRPPGAETSTTRSPIATKPSDWYRVMSRPNLVRGLALARKGQPDRAIADFDHTIAANQPMTGRSWGRSAAAIPRLYLSRGQAFASKGEYRPPIADYDEAIRLGREVPETFQARANAKPRWAMRTVPRPTATGRSAWDRSPTPRPITDRFRRTPRRGSRRPRTTGQGQQRSLG